MTVTILKKLSARTILLGACVLALAVAFLAGRAQPAQADNDLTPPPVPANIAVPAGSKLIFAGHAIGTQDYVCLPSATATSGFDWYGRPQATLFDRYEEQVATHYLSPNPDEGGTARPTWQDTKDTSAVWAASIASSTDSAYVDPGAIAWLKLQAVGSRVGPTGGDKLAETAFIQRVNTIGGKTPATGCGTSAEVGNKAFIPYEADYFFYEYDGE